MSDLYNVLFLCTGNSARSILGEALVNHWGKGRFRGFSAGSHPKGEVNPLAIEVLTRYHMPTESLRSKSWDEFARPGAPPLDFVFIVCDRAAKEICPLWPGQPMTAPWGIEDPAAVEGTDEVKRRAFTRRSGSSTRASKSSRVCGWSSWTACHCSTSSTPSERRPPVATRGNCSRAQGPRVDWFMRRA